MENKRAFTLIELLVVVGIMAILAAITAPAIAPLLRNSSLRAGAAQMRAAIMRARTMAVANSVYCVPLIPIKVKDNPSQYALPGGAPDVWFDDAWPAGAANIGAFARDRGGRSGSCHRNTDTGTGIKTHGFEDITVAKDVELEDVLSVWAWISKDVTGVGLAVKKGTSSWAFADSGIAYWGADVSGGAGKKISPTLPATRKWVQLAVSFKDLGLSEGESIKGIRFYRTTASSGDTTRIWWDMALIWDVYILPVGILPDPTLATYPIEFENDGRLKPTAGGNWSDRMIIVRDLGNPEPDEYDDDTLETDVGYRVWECEPFTEDDSEVDPNYGFWSSGESYEDYGLDRVNGTGDLYDANSKGEGKNEWSYEGFGLASPPTSPPAGQMYIKINKITGSARVCAHPGG